MTQETKPPFATQASHTGLPVLVLVLVVPISVELPATTPGKATDGGPVTQKLYSLFAFLSRRMEIQTPNFRLAQSWWLQICGD